MNRLFRRLGVCGCYYRTTCSWCREDAEEKPKEKSDTKESTDDIAIEEFRIKVIWSGFGEDFHQIIRMEMTRNEAEKLLSKITKALSND